MILRIQLLWRSPNLRAAPRLHPSSCHSRNLQFSSSRARHDTLSFPDPSNGRPGAATQDAAKHAKGSYARVLLVFGVGVPLGFIYHLLTSSTDNSSDETSFKPYTLREKQPISSTSSIFTLFPQSSLAVDLDSPALSRAIKSVQFKQPQLQIARSYTPLPPVYHSVSDQYNHDDDHGRGKYDNRDDLRFLIRKEENGEVSGYLHRIPVDSTIDVRGPHADYTFPENQRVAQVLFLAGGTGIAPAMQVADMLKGEAQICVLWANRRREDCMGGVSDGSPESSTIDRIWSWLKSPWNFSASSQNLTISAQKAVEREKEEDEREGKDRGRDGARNDQRLVGPIVRQLEQIKTAHRAAATNLHVEYFVDEENTFIQAQHVKTVLSHLDTLYHSSRMSYSDSKEESALTDQVANGAENFAVTASQPAQVRIVFVSGPEGFVRYWAGAKQWSDGVEKQGPLGGALAKMNLRGWQVVKL